MTATRVLHDIGFSCNVWEERNGTFTVETPIRTESGFPTLEGAKLFAITLGRIDERNKDGA